MFFRFLVISVENWISDVFRISGDVSVENGISDVFQILGDFSSNT